MAYKPGNKGVLTGSVVSEFILFSKKISSNREFELHIVEGKWVGMRSYILCRFLFLRLAACLNGLKKLII